MYFKTSKRNGFALTEIVVALFFVTLAITLVTGLGQQVMQLARNSRQTAAIVEIRSKSNSISRNLDSWLGKMRSSLHTGGTYAACIPDPSAASSVFKCPAVDQTLLDNDAELKKIAGTQLHASTATVIDLMGDKIAGPADAPIFLDLDGRLCENPNTSACPLKSTGYLLRSNPDTASNPGAVRFVVKVQPNGTSTSRGSTPLRTQYFTIDVGSEWNQSSGFCPSGSIKMGYLSNGNPNCINPTKKCASGKIHLGLDTSGNPVCQDPISCASGGVVVDVQSNNLVCSQTTPCEQSQIFLGYYSGTGAPMCSGTNLSCPEGEVQVGIQEASGNLTALCKKLPSCNDAQKLSYDGSKFVCQSASIASNCAAGEVVVGINTDGSAKCEAAERTLASTELTCPSGKYVSGLKSDGEVICENLPSGASNTNTNTNTAVTGSGLSCRTETSNGYFQVANAYCSAGEKRTGGGCKESGSAYMYYNYPMVHADGREGWECTSGSTGTLAQAYAICCTSSAQASTPTSPSGWPQSLSCAGGGAEIFPILFSKGTDVSNGNLNPNHINYVLPAREGGNMLLTYNVSTGAFISIVGQYGQGNGPGVAAEGCKRNMLNPGTCQTFSNYPQTSVRFANGTSQSYRTHSRDPSLTQFCKGRGFSTYSSVVEENYIGTLAKHNGSGWETNAYGMSIKEITCCN